MNPSPAPLDPPSLQRGGLSRLRRNQYLVLLAGSALVTAVLVFYSQTRAFVWDEGFHLIAARLIADGRRPYIDFCFPQTPLNAYWNAGVMLLFGPSWHAVHLFAALFTAGAAFLTADWVLANFPVLRWRLAAALAALVLVAFNLQVFEFGPVGQAYGVGLFFVAASFRVALVARDRGKLRYCFLAGLLAGIAAGSTLLTAPVAPVLLFWLLRYGNRGRMFRTVIAFAAGLVIPFAPVAWLFFAGPRQTLFNVVQYQAIYRRVNWEGADAHDAETLSSWLNSTQTLSSTLLAVAALLSLWRSRNRYSPRQRSDFYLALWLVLALILYISTAHPTFERYYLFAVPFFAIITTLGLFLVGSRLGSPYRPFWPCALLIALMTLSLARAIFVDRDSMQWKDYVEISNKVKQVTPPGRAFYADELVYFILDRTPPPGLEFSYSHKLELPPAQKALYHIKSENDIKKEIEAGVYSTVESCKDEIIDSFNLRNLFSKQADVEDCTVFWDKKPAPARAPAPAHK